MRSPAEIAAAVIRPEIRALTAYAVARADGMIKLDAMEVPYRLPAEVAAKVAAAVAAVPVNRYPDGSGEIVQRALRDAFGIPESLGLLLGNGSDELLQILTVAVARPGVTVMAPEPSFVMYRMNALYAGARFVGVPLAPDFALDTGGDARCDREGAARARLSRLSEQSDGQSFRGRERRGRPARRAGTRGRRRGVSRVRRRELPAAPCGVPEPRPGADRLEDRNGGPAAGLRDRGPGVDGGIEQGAPALQPQRADAGGGAGPAGRTGDARRAGGADHGPSARAFMPHSRVSPVSPPFRRTPTSCWRACPTRPAGSSTSSPRASSSRTCTDGTRCSSTACG